MKLASSAQWRTVGSLLSPNTNRLLDPIILIVYIVSAYITNFWLNTIINDGHVNDEKPFQLLLSLNFGYWTFFCSSCTKTGSFKHLERCHGERDLSSTDEAAV